MFFQAAFVAHVLGFGYCEMMEMEIDEFLQWFEKAKEIIEAGKD